MYKRIFLIVIDSVGIGEMQDAKEYGDEGANTLKNISLATNGLNLPTMARLGLGNISEIKGVHPTENPEAVYTKMAEMSVGKDTMTGHWELMGLNIQTPFQTFTERGFPESLIKELSERTGRNIVGNKAASGTEILDEYGLHQLETGDLIVYTSADSVLQIAAHEEKVGLDTLYEACEIARELTMQDEYKVGRVIARPFIGTEVGAFKRTPNRHDYALKPFGKTTLDFLKEAGYSVKAFGKISDIFDGEGITSSKKQATNEEGMENFIASIKDSFEGLAFLNLVDFDALYGHRRDPKGYKKALESFDQQLAIFIEHMKEDDLVIITADHGNDPTHHGTDHTREYVPMLAYSKGIKAQEIPIRQTFADIGATISDNFKVSQTKYGTSFLNTLKK